MFSHLNLSFQKKFSCILLILIQESYKLLRIRLKNTSTTMLREIISLNLNFPTSKELDIFQGYPPTENLLHISLQNPYIRKILWIKFHNLSGRKRKKDSHKFRKNHTGIHIDW